MKFPPEWPTVLLTLRFLACKYICAKARFVDLCMFTLSQSFISNLVEISSHHSIFDSNMLLLHFQNRIVKFSVCSAIGQSFIFYTVATFDPLVCSTVTTTRKIFSVLLSIFTKGHNLSSSGWAGISLSIGGILSEIQAKYSASRARHYKSKVSM